MRTLLYIFLVRSAIKRKKDLFSLKRSATCAMAKNNLLKRFATSALCFKLQNAHLCILPIVEPFSVLSARNENQSLDVVAIFYLCFQIFL